MPSLLAQSFLALMLLSHASSSALGQSALPVAQPTATANSAPANQPTVSSQAPAPKSQVKLEIVYASGVLTVDAANASLNQVLREVAQKTGMKVSGGVTDERVFGHYGPMPVAELLASLLDGTGSNMLLLAGTSGPSELVLTPRRGGATPPNPSAAVAGNESRDQPQEQYVPPVRPFQPPVALGRGPVRANADGSPSFGPPIQTGAPSGDGPTTPQQIYDQLQSQSPSAAAPPDQ